MTQVQRNIALALRRVYRNKGGKRYNEVHQGVELCAREIAKALGLEPRDFLLVACPSSLTDRDQ